MFMDLQTQRLILKCISADDNEFILRQFSTDEVNRYLFDEEPMTDISEADELIKFYCQPEPRYQHRWILVEKQSGEKIGTCGFHCWNTNEHYIDIGYDLQPMYWRKGYMTEAASAIIDFAREKMAVKKIDAHIAVDNIASQKLAEHFGFRFEGRTEVLNFRGSDYLHRIYTLYLDGDNKE